MADTSSFVARAAFTIEPDRYYRVELRNGCLYFLRIGGQFDLDRAGSGFVPNAGLLGALLMVGVSKALSSKNDKAQFIARDAAHDPEELLTIHPHNFRLLSADVKSATFLPKKWFPSHGRHVGRMVIEKWDGTSQEYWFQRSEDQEKAIEHLSTLLGRTMDNRVP